MYPSLVFPVCGAKGRLQGMRRLHYIFGMAPLPAALLDAKSKPKNMQFGTLCFCSEDTAHRVGHHGCDLEEYAERTLIHVL